MSPTRPSDNEALAQALAEDQEEGMGEMEAMAGTAWMARGSGGQGWVTSEKFPEIIPLQKCNN